MPAQPSIDVPFALSTWALRGPNDFHHRAGHPEFACSRRNRAWLIALLHISWVGSLSLGANHRREADLHFFHRHTRSMFFRLPPLVGKVLFGLYRVGPFDLLMAFRLLYITGYATLMKSVYTSDNNRIFLDGSGRGLNYCPTPYFYLE